ncbi:MAG TPA: hypothetical protein VGM67_20795 [Gemmatimonadaceae bacterium]
MLTVAAAAPLAAQERGLPDRIVGSSRTVLQHLVDSARTAGLPTAPLYDKAAEGVLKGADDDRIVVVVRSLTRELGEARDALGPMGTSAEQLPLLTSAASALHAGLPVADLRRLAHRGGSQPDASTLATALVTLVDLVAKRVPVNVATSSIQNLIDRRATVRQFSDLRAGVDEDIAAGHAPEASVVARVRAQLGGSPP